LDERACIKREWLMMPVSILENGLVFQYTLFVHKNDLKNLHTEIFHPGLQLLQNTKDHIRT
jgi:hypothetical protein